MKHFIGVQQILPDLFRAKQWQEPWQVQLLYGQWTDIAGPEIGRGSIPVAIRGQVLWLYVENGIWAQEIHYRQSELLKRIGAAVPGLSLRSLRCQVETSFFQTSGQPPAPLPKKQRQEGDSSHRAGFDGIADSACREALLRLWRSL